MAREKDKEKNAPAGARWRRWFALAAVVGAFVSTGLAARSVAHYVATDARFTLSPDRAGAFQLSGLRYASRAKVMRVFAADFGRSVYSIPLDERRRRLLAIDWIEDASVSRIWPDRVVVRLRERRPVAFVHFRSNVLLIDENGVLLDTPSRSRFTFPVLAGVNESQTELQRARRVRAMLALLQDLGPHSKDVSEVNAADPDSLRMVAQAGGRAVELWMGDSNFARRYETFLSHYPEMQRRSPGGKTFDLRLDGRILEKE